jgi:orotate phosphoribosyltransferase
MGGLAKKIGEGLAKMKAAGKPIDRFCFVEKAFGPVGLISVASELVRQFDLPAVHYRSYAWNAKDVRVASGMPAPGERLCAIYDVAVSGAMLAHTAHYFRQFHEADVCAAVVYYDLEEGAKDCLASSNVELFSVTKKQEFLPPLTGEYESIFHEPLEEPSIEHEIDPALVDKVKQGLEGAALPQENAIVDAFQSYIDRHADELGIGRLAIGQERLRGRT